MDKKTQFLQELENLGDSYFYDMVGDLTDEEILTKIVEDINQTYLPGMKGWESLADAFPFILTNCSQADLDHLLRRFGHVPSEVGGSYQFFSHVGEVLSRAIETRKIAGDMNNRK